MILEKKKAVIIRCTNDGWKENVHLTIHCLRSKKRSDPVPEDSTWNFMKAEVIAIEKVAFDLKVLTSDVWEKIDLEDVKIRWLGWKSGYAYRIWVSTYGLSTGLYALDDLHSFTFRHEDKRNWFSKILRIGN